MNFESRHFVSRHSGFMMLAELLQAGNPLLQNNPISVPLQSHPDEILQRPIPSYTQRIELLVNCSKDKAQLWKTLQNAKFARLLFQHLKDSGRLILGP